MVKQLYHTRISFVVLGIILILPLNLLSTLPVYGALNENEGFNSEGHELKPEVNSETFFEYRRTSDWERRIFPENFSSFHTQQDTLKSPPRPRLHLKAPGNLPGIELEFQVHSLQAFQTVVPSDNLSKRFDLHKDRPLLLPPSINAPDYNGGFLRFTW